MQLLPPESDLARVESAVRSHLERGAIVDLVRIARHLDKSKRTLQRELAAHGTSFRALVQAVRREMAFELLTASALTVAGVSLAVGYADAKALRRAFHRWGTPPPARYRTLHRTRPQAKSA